MKLPCIECVCLPICKQKYLNKFMWDPKVMHREFDAFDAVRNDCSLIEDYVISILPNTNSVPVIGNKQVYELADFMQGIKI